MSRSLYTYYFLVRFGWLVTTRNGYSCYFVLFVDGITYKLTESHIKAVGEQVQIALQVGKSQSNQDLTGREGVLLKQPRYRQTHSKSSLLVVPGFPVLGSSIMVLAGR